MPRTPRAAKAPQPTRPRPIKPANDGRAVQLVLDGTCAPTKAATAPRRTEKALQAQTRQVFSFLGFQSLETGLPRTPVTCPHCQRQHTPHDGRGANTKGTPDLLVFRRNDFPAVAILIEMKGDGTVVDAAQQALADDGRSSICRGIDDGVRALYAVEKQMHEYRLSPDRVEQYRRYFKSNQGNPG